MLILDAPLMVSNKKPYLCSQNYIHMKKNSWTIVLLSAAFLVGCTAENTTSTESETKTETVEDQYEYYGTKELTADGAISVDEMLVILEKEGTFKGKIKSTLAAVCKTAGCWVTLPNPKGEPIRVFFGDHDFFVPTDTPEGVEVILEGETYVQTSSVEIQQHLLEDEYGVGKVPQEKLDAIKGDLIEIGFDASGILIKK